MNSKTDPNYSELSGKKQSSTDGTPILTQQSQLAVPIPGLAMADAPVKEEAIALETSPARPMDTCPTTALDLTPNAITSFIQGHVWKFAKTMPQNPHWYVVKEKCRSAEEFERMVIHIRMFGYKEKFKGLYYTVFDWQTP